VPHPFLTDSIGYSDIDWDEEQWSLEPGAVLAYETCLEDDEFFAMEQLDLMGLHE